MSIQVSDWIGLTSSILSRVAYATSLFDQDGIQVRFMNNRTEGNNITTENQALQLVQQIKFSGLTPLGTQMWQKILQPLVLGPARSGSLQKPVVVIGKLSLPCTWDRADGQPLPTELPLVRTRMRLSTSS